MRAARLPLLLVAAASLAVAGACGSGPSTGTGGAATGGAGGAVTTTTSHASSTTGAVAVGSGGSLPLTDHFTVTGVVTDGAQPVEGAIVMQGGGQPAFTTAADGAYTIELTTSLPGNVTVVAAKLGYRATGVELFDLPDGPVELPLKIVTPPDNTAYVYGDPGTGDPSHDSSTTRCGHCHSTYVKDFRTSAHARAAKDPLVQDLYAGVSEAHADAASCQAAGGVWRAGLVPGDAAHATASKCYLGAGVLPELNPSCGGASGLACDDPAIAAAHAPTAFGRCADCHAPGIDGKAGGRSLLEAVGVAYDAGNHCDVCHHARDVDLTRPPGVGGALVLQRPHDQVSPTPGAMLIQVMYGPDPDVPDGFMGGSYQPKFRSSELCGACHEQRQEALVPGAALDPARWPGGLPTHSTYSEWAASAYNGPGTTCQFCHMPADDTGLTNSLDTTKPAGAGIAAGFPRAPENLRRHLFRDPLQGNPRLLDGAVTVELATMPAGAALGVAVKIENLTAGHGIPTGEPMRSLLLVLRAEACGAELAASGGETLDDWGGASAQGIVGAGVSVAGSQLTWATGAAQVGAVVRAVRPTGTYVDYAGTGFFADPALSPMEKGLEIQTPVGEATVSAAAGGVLTLSQALPLQAGDVVYVGEALAWPPVDGSVSAALAGRAGLSFARTLVDAAGARGVPHFRAVDMVSDNRLAPGGAAITQHAFAIPAGCSAATVSAAVLYRPIPVALARERGWDARDYVVATASASVALP